MDSMPMPNWATLHPSELRCTLMSYAVPYWTTQHHVSYTAPYNWATYSTRTRTFIIMPDCPVLEIGDPSPVPEC
jgi:hypothetical protein